MTTPRHRGESITAELCWRGFQWETMRHQIFTARGSYYAEQAAEAESRAAFYEAQLFELTGMGVD